MQKLYKELSQAVILMNPGRVKLLANNVLAKGLPPEEAIQEGLAIGMKEVGRLFACKEYFVPEVLVCAKAMYAGFDILKEKVMEGRMTTKGSIAIGVVEGDYHDIGKNIVKLMLEASGFRMIDLGKNVNTQQVKEVVQSQKPEVIALSTLMTTTMDSMEEIISSLSSSYPDLKYMIGGAPVSADYAKHIGAHFYGKDASEAVKGAHKLIGLTLEG